MVTGILLIVPFFLSLLIFGMKKVKWIRALALFGALAEFVISVTGLHLYMNHCHCVMMFDIGWIAKLGITLRFGMDGLSLLLVLLTTFLIPVIILSSWDQDHKNPSAFYGLIFLMEAAFIGVFSAFDGLIFYIFWEMALIPAYFICAFWGGNERIRITFKFFIYTFVGSLFMLVALIYVYYQTPAPHSFALESLYSAQLSQEAQVWVFFAFFLAFAIKIPIFPFHTWQPDTYTESPAAGTMLLAGIMLKMGIYGLIRILLPLCHQVIGMGGHFAMILAITGIVYASIIAIMQKDMKRLVAYSSIAHVGLISAGIFSLTAKALEGAVIQMISHGINIVGLFIVISIIERRVKTRDIASLGGIALKAPWLAVCFMIILLGSIALPLTTGFIGVFLLLLGLFEYSIWVASVAGLTVIFSVVYMLWMYQRTMLGKNNDLTSGFRDLSFTESLALIPLVIMIFWIGIYPEFFLHLAEPAVRDILSLIH
jgi:NADH-quinone oxidoreductase subunit M